MTSRPLHNRVVIDGIDDESRTADRRLMPDTDQEMPSHGGGISTCLGGRDRKGNILPISSKIGDGGLFSTWTASEATLDGRDGVIMKEGDILSALAQKTAPGASP